MNSFIVWIKRLFAPKEYTANTMTPEQEWYRDNPIKHAEAHPWPIAHAEVKRGQGFDPASLFGSGIHVEPDFNGEGKAIGVSAVPEYSVPTTCRSPIASPDDITSEFDKFWREIEQHKEEFAAAYLKETNIPPSEAVMNYGTKLDGMNLVCQIWFTRRQL